VIDSRHQTFLTLCAVGSYTKTAQHLHLSQPAVTQHIQYLEGMYNCRLVVYENRRVVLTPAGEQLREMLERMAADAKRFRRTLQKNGGTGKNIVFGATLSIGEYLMPQVIAELLEHDASLNVHMEVANSQILLERLRNGELDFALIEGMIDKARYHALVFSEERFVPICAPNCSLAGRTVDFREILQFPLVLREKGSGTREIFEHILGQYNYSVSSFQKVIEIGNMAAIKHLVARNIGISFMYELVAANDVHGGELAIVDIAGFDVRREFNFVCLRGSAFVDQSLEYFRMFKEAAHRISSAQRIT
jgi:DNA-binding transcriptional LysR family regulator